MEITFGPSAAETVLDALIEEDSVSDALSVDEDGYICQGDARVTDGYGEPLMVENFGGAIHFPAHNLTVDDAGFVVLESGERVSDEFDGRSKEAIVAFRDNNGEWGGLLRDDFSSIVEFVESTRDDK